MVVEDSRPDRKPRMPPNLTTLVYRLRRLAGPPATDSDADLLGRFARLRDEAAFAALVDRHGPMVFGVCRRVLHDAHDAEDAAQAAFLVLARRAGSVGRPDRLAGWLYAVAYRVASAARSRSRRRGRYETALASDRPDSRRDPLSEISARELLEALEAEVHDLPEAYRLPLVLCCLEGLSQEEAASRLGCTPGSVRGRLERGRKRLHARLVRRGLTLPAALAAVLASRSAVSAALASVTVRGAMAFVSGGNGVVSQQVIALANGGLKAMFWTKMKITLVVLAMSGLLGSGAGWIATVVGEGDAASQALALSAAPAADADPKLKTKVADDKADREKKELLARMIAAEKAERLRRVEREAKREALLQAVARLRVLTEVAEKSDLILSNELVEERQKLAELEERRREEEADVKASRMPSDHEVIHAKEEDRLRVMAFGVKHSMEKAIDDRLLKQLETQQKQARAKREHLESERRLLRKKQIEIMLATKKGMIAKEEDILRLERKRDSLRQESDRRRSVALDRIQQLEGGAVAEDPNRLQKTMERRIEAIQRELAEMRKELRRLKSGAKE